MSQPKPILQVYEVGETTVVGFGGEDVLDGVNVADCREEMLRLIDNEQCQVLAFDLTGVQLIPSGLLGLLASIRQHDVEVHLYNPSDDVRDALSVTHLDRLMKVHDIAVSKPESSK